MAQEVPAKNHSTTVKHVVWPEHGTGRTARMQACTHCGGKPLIARRCGKRRICAVCSHCGYHHRLKGLEK